MEKGSEMEMTDSEFLTHIIAEICNYSVKNEMDPDDTLSTVADNIKDLLTISTFMNWKLENDQPEIIRCRECWKHDFDNCPFNEYWGVKTPDDWYCADGKRAKEAEE